MEYVPKEVYIKIKQNLDGVQDSCVLLSVAVTFLDYFECLNVIH
jgi:hypothetical protein